MSTRGHCMLLERVDGGADAPEGTAAAGLLDRSRT